MRQVRGVLFVDYVKMLRAQPAARVEAALAAEDLPYLTMTIDPNGWYPMATFERFGNAIFEIVARGQMFPVQLWGRYSATILHKTNPTLLAPDRPTETLNRFRVMRQTFFDFEALEVPLLHDDEAQIVIRYHMGMPAEEAASYQTMGFFESLLELAGATQIRADLRQKSWAGDPRTLLVIHWTPPAG